jgi:predicted pyridoxine 5'-phosphate oxidase superfamily flavin-nucleotide-binding protein
MISDKLKLFIETIDRAYVASADESGVPHLAAGTDPKIPDPRHLVFEAWFCPTTLRNVARNPRVTVAIVVPDSGAGYQLCGTVETMIDTAVLDGYAPGTEEPGLPQVQSRLVVRVDEVMEFSAGVHSDRPLE